MTQEERTRLAWTMLESTFSVVTQVRNVDRIAVVTLYPPVISLAEKYKMEVIIESEQISESVSVDFGSKEAKRLGAGSVLRLPIDLPLITSEDIEIILNHDKAEPSAVIVPSRDGTGTNALLRRPPDLFPSYFGSDSFAKHLREADAAKAACTVIRLPRIALDIDDPDDIEDLMKYSQIMPVFEVLEEMRTIERLWALKFRESNKREA